MLKILQHRPEILLAPGLVNRISAGFLQFRRAVKGN